MDNTEIKHYILDNLNNTRAPDDIILDLCQKYGLAWQEAEALVLQLQEENRDNITLRQAPLLTAIALVTFIAGLVVLVIGIYPIVLLLITLIQHSNIHRIFNSWQFYLAVDIMVHAGLHPFVAVPLGIAMILGSLIGMQDVWAALLPRLKIGR